MIIVSSRKFRDNQNTYFEKANTEEVILQTLRYGSFRLVPVRENDAAYQDVRRASAEKNAALVANFHKGEKAAALSNANALDPAPVPAAIDIAELVKTAVQEAVAAAVPAAAAAAAAAQAQMLSQPAEPESKPQRAARGSRKSSASKAKTDAQAKDTAAESDDDRPQLILQPALPDPAPVEPAPQPVEEPVASAPDRSADSEYQPLFADEKPVRAVAAPARLSHIEPEKPAPEPAAPARPVSPEPVRPVPVQAARQVPRVALPVEEELEHEPIPEPSDEVRRHIHPVTEASPDVKPDFVDPGLYTDYEDSYIVGEERPDLEAQLAAYRKQDKGGFFKRLFKK